MWWWDLESFINSLPNIHYINPNSLSIVTEQEKSFKILELPLLSRELGLIIFMLLSIITSSTYNI